MPAFRVAIFGSSTSALDLAEELLLKHIDVAAIVFPRGVRAIGASRRAGALGIACVDVGSSVNAPQTVDRLAELGCDLFANWGHEERFCASLLAAPVQGVLNLHPGIIPGARGREPVFGAMLEGWPVITQTVHLMGRNFDDGPIIATRDIGIDDGPYRDAVEERLHQDAVQFYATAILKVLNGYRGYAGTGISRYFPALRDDAYTVAWSDNGEAILRRLRALSPFRALRAGGPGDTGEAWIWRAERSPTQTTTASPGQVLQVSSLGIDVSARDGVIRITDYELPSLGQKGVDQIKAGMLFTSLRETCPEAATP